MSNPQKNLNFGALIERTLRVTKQHFLQLFKELDIDITTEQWVLIDFLYQNDGISQTELANGSFKNAPTISRIIDLLKKKELVIKKQSTEDKRQYLIFLTEKAKALHEKAYPKVLEFRKQGWEGLSYKDYQQLEKIMNTIFHNFG